jgi:hypothetical protein
MPQMLELDTAAIAALQVHLLWAESGGWKRRAIACPRLLKYIKMPRNHHRSPNKSLQRSVNHKVLGRGRDVSAPWRAQRARVLTSQPAAAELSR